VISGSLAVVDDALPNGFHDAELMLVEVDWGVERASFLGKADVSDGKSAQKYRAFRLVVDGIRSLSLPASLGPTRTDGAFSVDFRDDGWCGGFEGWPPDRLPADPRFPEAWVYSFFMHALNDFVTVQAMSAEFEWIGDALDRVDSSRGE